MFFLLRMAFWLSVVLVLIPGSGSQLQSGGPTIGAIDAVSAAGAAVSDMSQFCGRQPDACVVGANAAVAFGQRAQAGAKVVVEFLSEKMNPGEPAKTASIKAPAQAGNKASQHTLTPADLQPTWRAPAARKEVQNRKPA